MTLILDAGPEDAEAIAALHAASWRATYRGIVSDDFLDGAAGQALLDLWRERLAKPAEVARRWLARIESDGRLDAFCCVFLDADPRWGALLDNLHVAPDHHGRGLGRALIAAAADWVIAERPGSGLHLWVYSRNAPARRFYERLGGQLAGSERGHALDGGPVDRVRYVWRHPAELVRAARRARMTPLNRYVIAVVPDLFFSTKIAATAEAAGVPLELLPASQALERCRREPPALVILDLSAGEPPLELARALRADASTSELPIAGFYSHVEGGTRLAALAAGVDPVLPRSAFVQRLPALLAGEAPREP